MPKFLYIAIIISISSFSCQKDVAIPKYQLQDLYGHWSLFSYASYRIAGLINSPIDEVIIERSLQYRELKSGSVRIETLFEVEPTGYPYDIYFEHTLIIEERTKGFEHYLSGFINKFIEFHGSDTLILHDDRREGAVYSFVMIK